MRLFLSIAALVLMATPAMATKLPVRPLCDAEKFGLEKCPNDIGHFLDTLSQCSFWSGEERSDDARAKEIDKAMKDLNCGDLHCEYADLIHKYKGQQNALHLIQDTLAAISGEKPENYADSCK